MLLSVREQTRFHWRRSSHNSPWSQQPPITTKHQPRRLQKKPLETETESRHLVAETCERRSTNLGPTGNPRKERRRVGGSRRNLL
jgi:hypothetical protein